MLKIGVFASAYYTSLSHSLDVQIICEFFPEKFNEFKGQRGDWMDGSPSEIFQNYSESGLESAHLLKGEKE